MDDQLIALSVVDILPIGVVANQFISSPAFSFLDLRTYATVRELEFTLQMSKQATSIAHYYAGRLLTSVADPIAVGACRRLIWPTYTPAGRALVRPRGLLLRPWKLCLARSPATTHIRTAAAPSSTQPDAEAFSPAMQTWIPWASLAASSRASDGEHTVPLAEQVDPDNIGVITGSEVVDWGTHRAGLGLPKDGTSGGRDGIAVCAALVGPKVAQSMQVVAQE